MLPSRSMFQHTFENVGSVDLVRIPLLGDRNVLADLKKIGSRGEVRDRIGHDGEELQGGAR